MKALLLRLEDLSRRHDQFTFDLRCNCRVLQGVVAGYHHPVGSTMRGPMEAIEQALAQDGILRVEREVGGRLVYTSSRLFTALEQAMTFARQQGGDSVFNLTREQLVHLMEPPDRSEQFIPSPFQ